MGRAERVEALERRAPELQDRAPAARLHDCELVPADAAGDARAQCLAGRLLGREAGREVGQRILEAAAVGELGRREEPPLHPLAEPLERFADPLDLADVDTDAANRQ